MISRLIDESKIKKIRELLETSSRIVITCHIAPDGDALGSSLALANVLEQLDREARVITPDTPPKIFKFLPGFKDIVIFSKYPDFAKELIDDADLIFCLDYNSLHRVDRLADPIRNSAAPKVMIDHHLSPEEFADVVISHPDVSSTSMLLFRTLCRLELFPQIDKSAATCIYTGMMTDTGNFAYNSNDPELYIVISELLRKGINKDEIYDRVMNSSSASRLRLNGFALAEKMKIFEDHHCALITLTRKELNHFHYQKGDTESLVNQPLKIPGIIYSFYLREEEGYIKVSARSRGNFPVNKICEKYFGGGGHLNAAGGEFDGTMEQAVEKFLSIIDDCNQYLPKNIKND